MDNILIIDDEKAVCSSLKYALNQDYSVFTANDTKKALDILDENNINIVLLDLKLGSENGLDLLRQIRAEHKETLVIIMTAFGSIKSTVEVIKEGAYYYLTKPIDLDELKLLLQKALEYQRLNNEVNYLNREVKQKYSLANIIGKSQSIRNIFELIEKIKDIDSNVLITGESGTGKEMAARALHYLSRRGQHHFEVVNCAAIPSSLLESELFGYEKGAFTGAVTRKAGKFELADKGTIFLDEIGDMEYNLQSKVLRVLQGKEITPLGSNRSRKVDIRVVAATNKDLEAEIEKGTFRPDLFYRLNVINIKLPPLRERREDIPLLVDKFINQYNIAFQKKVAGIDKDALEALENYDYKGNVRELENMIERAVALSAGAVITVDDLPPHFRRNVLEEQENKPFITINIGETLRDAEIKLIKRTLAACQGNKRKTAALLGISERGLHYKILEYKINT